MSERGGYRRRSDGMRSIATRRRGQPPLELIYLKLKEHKGTLNPQFDCL